MTYRAIMGHIPQSGIMTTVTVSEDLVSEIASFISVRLESSQTRIRVAVDGRDGAGKTTFADRVADALRDNGREVYRASIDDFQHPSAIRYRRGRESPEGYYFDGFDYVSLKRELLDPFAPWGSGQCQLACFKVETDREVEGVSIAVGPVAILIFDGVFLHRPELIDCWEMSLYLKVDPQVAFERGVRRDAEKSSRADLERLLYERRYAPGQVLYHDTIKPELVADIVIDNTNVHRPEFVRQ